MKKFFSLLFITIASISSAFAQNLSCEAVAGLNISDVTKFDSKVGFHAGVRGTYNFTENYVGAYVNAGALIALKGCQKDYGELLETKINAYYLEIPIHAGYKHALNENIAIFGEFGPYFGIGLFGKSKIKSEGESISVDTFSDEMGIKRFDMGLGFRLGVEFKNRIPVSIGYDFGLTNISDDSEDEGSFKNSNLSISIGYKF